MSNDVLVSSHDWRKHTDDIVVANIGIQLEVKLYLQKTKERGRREKIN